MHPFFEFVLAIVALSFLYKLVEAWIRKTSDRRSVEALNSELVARLEALEERVRVLERIVTDERYDLKRQFRDLGA